MYPLHDITHAPTTASSIHASVFPGAGTLPENLQSQAAHGRIEVLPVESLRCVLEPQADNLALLPIARWLAELVAPVNWLAITTESPQSDPGDRCREVCGLAWRSAARRGLVRHVLVRGASCIPY